MTESNASRSPCLLLRLILDLVAAGLVVFGLAYWWLGNVAHELAGTVMFLLLIAHNILNHRWYGGIRTASQKRRGLFNIAATLVLLIAMVVLLITSILISNALSPVMSSFGGFAVRQLHTLAAYWVLVLVSVHLGLRWTMIMNMVRGWMGIARENTVRRWLLRAMTTGIAVHGVWSSFVLGMGTKLSMQVSLDWWNFEESVAGFFLHCLAVAGLYIAVTYYGTKVIKGLGVRAANASQSR